MEAGEAVSAKYVYYAGKHWRYGGHRNHTGRVSLVSLQDSSTGTAAFPHELRPATPKQVEAIEWFLDKIARHEI